MKNKIALVICAVFICVKCECEDSKCADQIVQDILKDPTVVENIDISLQVPKFKQIKNVGVEDINKIILHLTSWFEDRLNETSFIFKHVSNKTKVFVKSFDFNVDFEKGNAKIDVDLTEEPNNETYKNKVENDIFKSMYPETTSYDVETTTAETVFNDTSFILNRTEKMDMIISKLNSVNNNIFKLTEFDTTYYDVNEDNSTDYPIIDYVEVYKDTTNEEFVYSPTEGSKAVKDIITGIYDVEHGSTETSIRRIIPQLVDTKTTAPPLVCHGEAFCNDFSKSVFPWVATIFITNSTKDSQFSYYCDGALLSDKVIITDARCMIISGKIWASEDVLVFLGKGNLQSFGSSEKVHKVKEVIVHPNFTFAESGKVTNDLALLVLEDVVEFKDNIKSACFHHDMEKEPEEAISTAWGLNGVLETILFNKKKNDNCFDQDEDIFCATYGNEVSLCPSYGGVYAIRHAGRWCLQGIFYGDPADRGICFTKNVYFTSLKNYVKWIDENVDNRNDLL